MKGGNGKIKIRNGNDRCKIMFIKNKIRIIGGEGNAGDRKVYNALLSSYNRSCAHTDEQQEDSTHNSQYKHFQERVT